MNFIEIKNRLQEKGLSYEDFMEESAAEIKKINPAELSDVEKKRLDYKTLNYQRSSRIIRTQNISEELRIILSEITVAQQWMVITESWCGDSAQNLPYIYLASTENPLIDLKILLRDSNPDVMEQFLTNGTRSIPILISFDNHGNELFRWGPRPKLAVELIKKWKAEGLQKPEWTEKLHLWYSKNKGRELENELIELISHSVQSHYSI
jgi:Thioredoxin